MRTAAPSTLPIFRSGSQAALLCETFLHVDVHYSIAELARRTGIPSSTVHREVRQLLDAGLLSERRIGNVRQVSANHHSPFFDPMLLLIQRAFGPTARLRQALRDMENVSEAWLFGSYARRLSGERGEAPRDVDVAVVVDGDPDEAYQACARVGASLGLKVNATIFSQSEWDDPDDVFVAQLREGVLVDLLDDAPPTRESE